jgi:hypothetical protein
MKKFSTPVRMLLITALLMGFVPKANGQNRSATHPAPTPAESAAEQIDKIFGMFHVPVNSFMRT